MSNKIYLKLKIQNEYIYKEFDCAKSFVFFLLYFSFIDGSIKCSSGVDPISNRMFNHSNLTAQYQNIDRK